MSFEARHSSRRTSKRNRSFVNDEIPTSSLIPFPSGRRSFFVELVKFHQDRGTPLPRFPTVSGQFIDLFELYCAVINRGGFHRSSSYDCWGDIVENLGLKRCPNLTVGIRQVYARYLAHYESMTISLDDDDLHDFEDFHNDSSVGAPRRKSIPTINVCNIPVPMTYNYESSVVNKSRNSSIRTTSTAVQQFAHSSNSYLDKIGLSLLCGLPNERRFVLDACMLLSTDYNHGHAICEHDHLLNLILAQIAVIPNSSTYGNLYMEWFSQVCDYKFAEFWMESVCNSDVQAFMSALELFQKVVFDFTEEELQANTNSSASHYLTSTIACFDGGSREYRRISAILYFLRHLSFEVRNHKNLAENAAVNQFLLMCVGNKFANLRVLALDTIANISSALILSKNCLFETFLDIILGLFKSPDGVDRIRCMEILTGFCCKELSIKLIVEKFDGRIFEEIVSLLTVQDLLVLLSCIGLLYQLTYLGPEICELVLKVKYVVDLLAALVTFDVQSMGLEALTSVKVIEQPKSLLSKAAHLHSSHSQQTSTNSSENSIGLDFERCTVKWLLTVFEQTNEESAGIFSNEIWPQYKKYCIRNNLNQSANAMTIIQFNRCVKLAFPAAPFKMVSSLDNSYYFNNIRRKNRKQSMLPPPPNGIIQYQNVLNNVHSVKPCQIATNLSLSEASEKVTATKVRPTCEPVPTTTAAAAKISKNSTTTDSVIKPSSDHKTALNNFVSRNKITQQNTSNKEVVDCSAEVVPIKTDASTKNISQTTSSSEVVSTHHSNASSVSSSDAATTAAAASVTQTNNQSPFLVQVMFAENNENNGATTASFKNQVCSNSSANVTVNASSTVATEQFCNSKITIPRTASAFLLGNNQLIFSPVSALQSSQNIQLKNIVKSMGGGVEANNPNTNCNVNAAPNQQLQVAPALIVPADVAVQQQQQLSQNQPIAQQHTRAAPSVIHHPNNNNNASITNIRPQVAPTPQSCNLNSIHLQEKTQHNSQNLTSASLVPNIVKPKHITAGSIAPPITTTTQPIVDQLLNPNNLLNGNCNMRTTKVGNHEMRGQVISNSVGIVQQQQQQQQHNRQIVTSVPNVTSLPSKITSNTAGLLNSVAAYQNGLAAATANTSCNNISSVAQSAAPNNTINGKCDFDLNGVVFKLVNEVPSVTSNGNEMQRKILYTSGTQNGGDGLSAAAALCHGVQQPHIVINGDINNHVDIENLKQSVNSLRTNQHTTQVNVEYQLQQNNNTISAISNSKDVTTTNFSLVPISTTTRKRRNSAETAPDMPGVTGQVYIATSGIVTMADNGSDRRQLSGFNKIKVNSDQARVNSSNEGSGGGSGGVAFNEKSIQNQQGKIVTPHTVNVINKKESGAPFSSIPSLHQAVNSVIAATAGGNMISVSSSSNSISNNQVVCSSSNSTCNVTKYIVQPVQFTSQDPNSAIHNTANSLNHIQDSNLNTAQLQMNNSSFSTSYQKASSLNHPPKQEQLQQQSSQPQFVCQVVPVVTHNSALQGKNLLPVSTSSSGNSSESFRSNTSNHHSTTNQQFSNNQSITQPGGFTNRCQNQNATVASSSSAHPPPPLNTAVSLNESSTNSTSNAAKAATASAPTAVTASGDQQTSSSDPRLIFRCEWDNCTSRFEKWQQVFHHCCRQHCADIGPTGAICKWNACDGLRRKKLSLFTHLQDKHCTEALLKRAAALAKSSGKEKGVTTSAAMPLMSSQAAESLYTMHTLHHALQRSGWTPPSKDHSSAVIEKEGPVSKAVRLNAALVLRNLSQHSQLGRELIKVHEKKLCIAATSCIEASPFLAKCLLNLCNL